jgi:hypothetical protein
MLAQILSANFDTVVARLQKKAAIMRRTKDREQSGWRPRAKGC